jgi:hypothetical protein
LSRCTQFADTPGSAKGRALERKRLTVVAQPAILGELLRRALAAQPGIAIVGPDETRIDALVLAVEGEVSAQMMVDLIRPITEFRVVAIEQGARRWSVWTFEPRRDERGEPSLGEILAVLRGDV